MRATVHIHAAKTSRAGRLAGDFQRAAAATGAVVGVCAVAAGFASFAQSSYNRTAYSTVTSAAEIKTGSLLVVSPSGNFCRNRTIDNSTWQIQDHGWVACDEALAKSGEPDSRGSRLDQISKAFRGN